MNKMTDRDRKAARLLQYDLPQSSAPFMGIASECGMTQTEMIEVIRSFKAEGLMRKFGAIVRHQKAGYGTNALVVWSVPPDAIEQAGKRFASLPSVSHCYQRQPAFMGRYNLFTMLHTREHDLTPILDEMAVSIGQNDYLILESLQEYKKTSPEYF
ncbi:MAG: hypothetical protein R6W75_11515 [Smithellaceae bacterium]